MSIKRYVWNACDDHGCHCDVVESADGDMVDYDDHATVVSELEARCAALAAESAVKQEFIKTCFRNAADGASMDGADIQELGERLGLFGRETYQPVLHGYICGHEAGEDTVYVIKKTPATDAFLAEVRAQGVEMFASKCREESKHANSSDHRDSWWVSGENAEEFAAQLRQEAQ